MQAITTIGLYIGLSYLACGFSALFGIAFGFTPPTAHLDDRMIALRYE